MYRCATDRRQLVEHRHHVLPAQAPPHRAQNCPLAISFRIWMSRCWSATRRCSRSFSLLQLLQPLHRVAIHRPTLGPPTVQRPLATSPPRHAACPEKRTRQPASASRPPPRDGDASCSNASSENPLGPFGQESLSYGVDRSERHWQYIVPSSPKRVSQETVQRTMPHRAVLCVQFLPEPRLRMLL